VRYDCGRDGETCSAGSEGAFCTSPPCVVQEDYCDGRYIMGCTEVEYRSVEDCSRFVNGACYERADGGLDCYSEPGIACSGYGSTCDGNVVVMCNGETVLRLDCRNNRYRTACFEDPTYGEAYCVLPGTPTCDEQGEAYCENNSLVFCFGGQLHRYYCPELGGTCAESASGSGYCTTQ
jgi:hypothetical protein